ncbi:hypothetical protein V1264_005043 [Littorina saxatilis]|uniref:Uncharacterized protein n=1 Tax=Littorina saxatilis TaxID=31220 RepID=A0AAN9B0L2_9CAEN
MSEPCSCLAGVWTNTASVSTSQGRMAVGTCKNDSLWTGEEAEILCAGRSVQAGDLHGPHQNQGQGRSPSTAGSERHRHKTSDPDVWDLRVGDPHDGR